MNKAKAEIVQGTIISTRFEFVEINFPSSCRILFFEEIFSIFEIFSPAGDLESDLARLEVVARVGHAGAG